MHSLFISFHFCKFIYDVSLAVMKFHIVELVKSAVIKNMRTCLKPF